MQKRPEKGGCEFYWVMEAATHDLRNRIGGILAASGFLADDAKGLLEQNHMALLESVESSCRVLLKLSDDLLDICALDSGKLRLHLQPTDVVSLINEVVALNRSSAERNGIRVQVAAANPLAPVYVDRLRMNQAVDCVVSSAISCSEPGNSIHIQASARLGKAVVLVRTEASKLSSAQLHALFNPFRRHATIKTAWGDRATAVTMAKAQRIVEAHGGAVKIRGGERRNPVIRVLLPIYDGKHKGNEAAQPPRPANA